LNEALKPFDTQRELAQRERALTGQATIPKPREVPRQRVLGAVDDAEVLSASALDCGLQEPAGVCGHELSGLDDCAFPTRLGQRFPPRDRRALTGGSEAAELQLTPV